MNTSVMTRAGLAGAAAVVAASLVSYPAAAGSSGASVSDDVLTVTGSGADDRIALRLAAGAAGTLEVDFGDDGTAEHSFDRSTFSRIFVELRGGNDQFRVDQVNGPFADEALTVDGGGGDDTMNGGDGVELFLGRGGDDAVDGNRGNDAAELGGGDDSFRWDPGDGSDLVEGVGGTDTLDFNGAGVAENMSLSANGRRALFLRDVANIRMDMNNVEVLDLTALGGPDRITINDMEGTGFRVADIDLSAPTGGPDGQADVVTVNGTANPDHIAVDVQDSRIDVAGLQTETRITGSETIDRLEINTLDGNDTVDVAAEVAALIGVVVDLGEGQV
ncbi:MAG: calcium-binding protein [Acidimicrobiales bacterium]